MSPQVVGNLQGEMSDIGQSSGNVHGGALGKTSPAVEQVEHSNGQHDWQLSQKTDGRVHEATVAQIAVEGCIGIIWSCQFGRKTWIFPS